MVCLRQPALRLDRVRYADGGTIPGNVTLASNGRTLIRMIARWAETDAPEYTIQFDANGGSGTMADLPGTTGVRNVLTRCAFTREGFSFTGWTATRKSDGKWLFNAELEDGEAAGWELFRYADGGATTNPTQADGDVLTFYAQWTATALKLDADNGEAARYCAFTAATPLGQLPIPQKAGHHFRGWFTAGGKQITSLSLPEDQALAGVDTLYARWLPHSDRPVLENYVSRTFDGNRYAHALSQLLTAAGQQEDKTYDAEQCLGDLDSVGMLTSTGGVKNSSFITSGFLEYYGPELTYEGKFVCDRYEDYVTQLAEKQTEQYYALVNLNLDGTNKRWAYLYEADGSSLKVLYNGCVTDITDVAEGISSANMFLYHGSDFYVQRPCLEGTYLHSGETLTIDLSCSAAPLETGGQEIWIACYTGEEQLVACRKTTIRLDEYLNGSAAVSMTENFDCCCVFIADDRWIPLCEAIDLQEQM